MTVADVIAQRIHREGPIPFDLFMELALYDVDGGFFTQGRGAGRAGRDFITSPEVGPLFGACVARALDGWWEELGAPDPFLVVEAGAGPGRLAREVLRAEPECLAALRYVLVERSPQLRAAQRELLQIEPADEAMGPFVHRTTEDEPVPVPAAGPVFAAIEDMPALPLASVVVANELLDNLPFGIAEFDGEHWQEVRVALDGNQFVELLVPTNPPPGVGPVDARTRVPIPRGLDDWIAECSGALGHGVVLLVDYMTAAPRRDWLRTYRDHARGAPPLAEPGAQDITADVLLPQLELAAQRAGFAIRSIEPQAQWLGALGIDELVADGQRAWDEGAARGDLDALAGRSRRREAEALLAPDGLGAHTVVVLTKS
jgi:NADH dehydrogenase [ubiquinone] 1 alpha subcomplex assembly factor 7